MIHNIFDDLPKQTSPTEIFKTLFQNSHVKLERIISTGQTSDWHDQAADEWVMLLQGHATLQFDDHSEIHLNAGDYLLIKAHQKHKVSWTNPKEICVWLVLHIEI